MRTAATVALRAVPRAALALPPAWRRRLTLLAAVLVALACTYVFWFRDSSFVSVQKVEVTGVAGPQARAIRTALTDAGLDMTTLHVRVGDLRRAVADFPVVRSVSAQGQFPHVLRVQVELNLPVALLQTAAGKLPIAADGLVLRDVPQSPGLPVLMARAAGAPERIDRGPASAMLLAVAAAPQPLRGRIRAVEIKPATGLTAHLRHGPDLIFGDASRIAAKWVAAARVLGSPAAHGATYIDLRLPERPAAGGLPTTSLLPLAPAGTSPLTAATTTTTTAAPTTTAPSTSPTPNSQLPTPATTSPTTTAPTTTGQSTTPSAPPSAANPTTGGAQQPSG